MVIKPARMYIWQGSVISEPKLIAMLKSGKMDETELFQTATARECFRETVALLKSGEDYFLAAEGAFIRDPASGDFKKTRMEKGFRLPAGLSVAGVRLEGKKFEALVWRAAFSFEGGEYAVRAKYSLREGEWSLSAASHENGVCACCGEPEKAACAGLSIGAAKKWMLDKLLRSHSFQAAVKAKENPEAPKMALLEALNLERE